MQMVRGKKRMREGGEKGLSFIHLLQRMAEAKFKGTPESETSEAGSHWK
jgi:hypothetical protein